MSKSPKQVALSAEKLRLLEALLREEGGRYNSFPLSFAQEGLWFLDQLQPGSPAYNIHAAVRLEGALDVSAFERSLREIVRRHEVLRASFPAVNGRPVQVIAPDSTLTFKRIDLEGFTRAEREAEARRLAQAEARQPFDLATGPLMRATLFELAAGEHILLLTQHHIVSDGWSLGVLVRELSALYEAFAAGGPSPLPELEIQYADYAAWQRSRLGGAELDAQLGYWRGRLAGAPPVLELPGDRARPAVQSFRGATERVLVEGALSEKVRELCRREGVTLYMTLLAAFQLLLARYSGQRDFLVGSPVAGRQTLQTEPLIGLFVNTIALRAQLAPRMSFRELLRRTRETVLEAQAHADVPFERVVEELRPERALSHAPLCQVVFALQQGVGVPERLGDLRLRRVEVADVTAKFDLTLVIEEQRGEGPLGGWVEYSTDLFDAATVRRMMRHYERVLEAVAANLDAEVDEVELLTVEERGQLLGEWAAPPGGAAVHTSARADEAAPVNVVALLEAQGRRTPDAVAVSDADRRLSYGELEARAARVARRLRGLGVGPESVVSVLMERSAEMVVAQLGVLKAGGAYLPLDPSLPPARLGLMLDDSRSAVVLTTARLLGRLPETSVTVLCLDRDSSPLTDEDEKEEETRAGSSGGNEVSPDNLAYVIYTSGSTGVPKGVELTHRGLLNLVRWHLRAFSLDASDRTTLLAGVSFDASVWEVWPTLCAGARLRVVPDEVRLSAEALRDWLVGERVTVSFVPTPVAERLLCADWGGVEGAALRWLLTGGDALHVRPAPGSPFMLANNYGPTENTVVATSCVVAPAETCEAPEEASVGADDAARVASRAALPPIGRAIEGVRVYVLDGRLRPVPIGVAGELFVGGEGLARGYRERAGLTAERFVPDPFSPSPGARLYRTGDVVRRLADGDIEYLRRADEQVKVRGFRVELGEVEAALRECAGVAECCVVARAGAGGERRLVGYVVPEGAGEFNASEARRQMAARLPEQMIPSALVELEALPLTPSGKIDRAALPEPTEPGALGGAAYRAPRSQAEQMLAAAWAETLGVARVGLDDNFFELGGHSLLATRVMSRVREAFGLDLALRRLFESPTVGELARCVEQEMKAGLSLPTPPLVRVPRDRELPLSFAQERMWFIEQMQPEDALYNIPAAVRLKGALDTDALRQTFAAVARRHEILRTRFEPGRDRPVQVINPAESVSAPVTTTDLTGLPESEREQAAARLLSEEAARPFALEGGELLRVALLRLAADEHLLLLTTHHIAADGWSMSVLIKEVVALYESYTGGEPARLPELRVQYADYAVWQREWLRGEVLDTQLAYWRERLRDAPELLELPSDRPRPAVQSHRGATSSFRLPGELSERLRELSRREGVTLYMTLLAAFQLLLARYSRQSDILVGSPVAGRSRLETENLVGLFVNTLVMRAHVAPRMSFRELLRRTREGVLEAQAHADVPFERVVEELRPERALSHAPLCQVVFALQQGVGVPPGLGALRLRREEVAGSTARLDLTLIMEEREEAGGAASPSLEAWVEYSTELFDAETVARLMSHYERVLAAVAADAGVKVWDVELLTPDERARLLVEWNRASAAADTPAEEMDSADTSAAARPRLVLEMFDERAARDPGAAAVVDGERELSYGELAERAEQLAAYLRRQGVGPEVLVGVLLERSAEMIVAQLGVLKSGGAYVPLDPAYPQERLSFMLEDARVRVLLTRERLLAQAPAAGTRVVCLDRDWAEIAEAGRGDGARGASGPVSAEGLAYVIYTSGSTGRPKGVELTHRSLLNFVRWHLETFHMTARDRMSLYCSVTFDASVWEVWTTLAAGASLCVVPDEVRLAPELLRDWIIGRGVTVSFLTTPVAERVLQVEWPRTGVALRWLLTGGDTLHERPRPGVSFALENVYGPTENTIVSTACEVKALAPGAVGDDAQNTLPSIGRQIRGVRAYLLDERMRPTPVGVAGEVYLGGANLARGYLRRAALTAERFVPDPFSGEAGARLYRTGDLARYTADGELWFVGRVDQQVKIRGNRVELGEVEAVLLEDARVRECIAVVSAADGGADKRIVAYVVCEPGVQGGGTAELRRSLRQRLPEYMLPSAIVALDALPLTPNGKVDRRALPRPEVEGADDDAFVAPRTPTEEVLAGIWSNLLGVARVGVEDNFFDLGGHSLLTTQLISQVREVFRVELPMRVPFEAPTLAALAGHVERAMRDEGAATATPIGRAPRDAELKLSSSQQRLWFLNRLDPDSPAYNIPAAVRLTGRLNVAALKQTFDEIERRHEVLRTVFETVEGRPRLRVNPPARGVLSVVSLLELPDGEREAEARRLMVSEARQPFDLATGPLMRATLFELAAGEHILLLTQHHIVSDGWSLGVLVRELSALYEAFAAGGPSPLPELEIQYADYAAWQRSRLGGAGLDAQLGYWRGRLAGAPPVLELPGDRARPAVQSFRGATERVQVSNELAERLRELCRREGVTLYMTLLAAFQLLLARYARREDIVVGTDIANRTRAETEPLIGLFVNQLVLRTDLSGDPTFRELLARVREVTLGAYAHQDFPFEKLVEELQPARDPSRNPLFQVMFIHQNAPMHRLHLPGLTLSPFELEEEGAVFDLSFAFLAGDDGGINASLRYNTDLFERATAARMLAQFGALLERIVERPEARLSSFEILTGPETERQAMDHLERKEARFKKLASLKPKAVRVSPEQVVRSENAAPGQTLPLVFRPEVEDVDLAAWAARNLGLLEEQLARHGGLLFTGFDLPSVAKFEEFVRSVCPELMSYGERSSPRTAVTGGVYTSTDHPADQHILLHNEQSYTFNWPMKIWFYCLRPASEGGRTPIADSRKIFRRLDPRLVERFAREGVMYVRNYGDGLGLPWQEVFQTRERAEVEEHCRRASIEFEWKDGDRLRTRQVRPAVRTHPRTGEPVWFNHAFFFNVSSLEQAARDSLLAGLPEEDVPFNTFYGDGSPIEPAVLAELSEAYRLETVSFPWRAGDVLMLDNMLVAHGREPFAGPRKIVVAMAEPFGSRDYHSAGTEQLHALSSP